MDRVRALAKREVRPWQVEDVKQSVRCSLLLLQGTHALILRCAGLGRLHGLLAAMVLRASARAQRIRAKEESSRHADVHERLADTPTARDRAIMKQAVAQAWAALGAVEHLLMHLHHLKRMTVRDLANVYGADAATIARRAAKARMLFAPNVRNALAARDPERATAEVMGLESHLSLSFVREITMGGES